MARPREFDEITALDAAVLRFWSHGYEATSVRELADSMGITGASLYNAFGDKRSLFQRSLERYVDRSIRNRIERMGHLPPRQALGGFFDEIITRSLNDADRKGCMLVNSAMEVAPHDPELQPTIADTLVLIEDFFRQCVEAGQREGTITRSQPADDLARLLLGALTGIRVLARSRPERALLEGLVRPLFALLDSPDTAGGPTPQERA